MPQFEIIGSQSRVSGGEGVEADEISVNELGVFFHKRGAIVAFVVHTPGLLVRAVDVRQTTR
jgi:hypothetical protein